MLWVFWVVLPFLVTSHGTKPPAARTISSERSKHLNGSLSPDHGSSKPFVSRICQIATGSQGSTRPPPVRLALVLATRAKFGREIKEFVGGLVREFSISASGTRVAAVLRRHGIPRVAFGFRKFHNLECTLKGISKLKFAGAAQVGAAELLSYTTRKLFGRRAVARNKTSNAVILISDGWARGKRVLRVSKRLRRRGIEVFVLAFSVRRRLRWNTKLVASKPISQHILFLKSHSELALLENKFKHQGFNRRCSGKVRFVYDECNRRCECKHEQLTNCYRVRKEFTSMSLEERRRYIRAFKRISSDKQFKRQFDRLARHHAHHFDKIHSRKFFFPWHRWYLLKLENLLRRADCRVTLPYWDWSRAVSEGRLWRSTHIRDVWNSGPHGLGGDGKGKCVPRGPFTLHKWKLSRWTRERCLTRQFNHFRKQSKMPNRVFVARMLKLPLTKFLRFLDRMREFMHKSLHSAIGGTMSLDISANSPEFWFHHAFLDKLWSDWQRRGTRFKFQYFGSVRQRMPGCRCRGWNFVDLDRQPMCVRVMYVDVTSSRKRKSKKLFGISHYHDDPENERR